jgi:PleD family two-component response regulator
MLYGAGCTLASCLNFGVHLSRRPTLALSSKLATVPRLDGLSILVVDDDPDAREALNNLLGSLGAKVTAEPSPCAALARLDKLRPDVIGLGYQNAIV